MTKERVLVIPGGFLPYNDTVTLLTYKHLRNIDAEFDVIALKGPDDEGLKKLIEADPAYRKFHVQYVCDYGQAVPTYEKKNVLSGIHYYHEYCRAAKKKALEYPYKVVYTSSVPAFTHLAGYWIKKALGGKITWIASFSDPLFRSPYKHDLESIREYSLLQKIGFYVYITIFMNSRHEKLAQRCADKVIYICLEQRDFSISQYSCSADCLQKSMVVPLNYIQEWDQDMIAAGSRLPAVHHPRVFSHFGRIYSLRRIDAFLEALTALKKEDPEIAGKIVFHQYGQLTQRYYDVIRKNHLEDVFQVHEKIPYQQARDLEMSSDGLVLFDSSVLPGQTIQPYLPSKTTEYLLLKKDMLIITTPTSPSWRIFTGFGYRCCHEDAAEIQAEIRRLADGQPQRHDYDFSSYENQTATGELTRYVDGILSSR